MTDRTQQIAKQLMESYFHSLPRRNWVSRSARSEKPGEKMVLYFLGKHANVGSPGLMVSEISGKLNLTSPTITQHINNLESQQLVERLSDPDDRRVVRIRLTDRGGQYVKHMDAVRLRMFMELVEHLGEEESLQLAELMRKATDFMRKQRERYMQYMENENGQPS